MAYEPAKIADIHAHVLPGVDHGAQSVGESIAMLKASFDAGVRFVAATHHYYAHEESPDAFIKRRNAASELLERHSEGMELPKLVLGAEIKYFKNMSGLFDLSPLCYGDSRFILIEPLYSPWENSFFDDIEQMILRQELVPVIAHVERFTSQAPKNYTRLLSDMGAVLQYNADHFLRYPKRAIKRIPEGATVVFGSDMHNDGERAPNLAPILSSCEKYMPERIFEGARKVTEKIFGAKS